MNPRLVVVELELGELPLQVNRIPEQDAKNSPDV